MHAHANTKTCKSHVNQRSEQPCLLLQILKKNTIQEMTRPLLFGFFFVRLLLVVETGKQTLMVSRLKD